MVYLVAGIFAACLAATMMAVSVLVMEPWNVLLWQAVILLPFALHMLLGEIVSLVGAENEYWARRRAVR